MTIALKDSGRPAPVLAGLARRTNIGVAVFVVLFALVTIKQPSYIEPAGFMTFLRRAAPLAILASGQVFVIVAGGFDLSVGSLITLTVIGGSMITGRRPCSDRGGHLRALCHRARGRPRSTAWWSALPQGALDHRLARHAALAERRRHDVVGRLAARLSAGQFPSLRPLRDQRTCRWSGRCRSPPSSCSSRRRSLGGDCTAPCSAVACFAVGDNPRAAELAGMQGRI